MQTISLHYINKTQHSSRKIKHTIVASVRTTVIIDTAAENWQWSEASLRHCQEYMMEEAVRGGGGLVNGYRGGLSRREVDLRMCCYKLKQMESVAEGSTCSGVEEAMRRLVARGEVIMGDEELRNAWDIAEELPRECGVVNSPAKCRFSSSWM